MTLVSHKQDPVGLVHDSRAYYAPNVLALTILWRRLLPESGSDDGVGGEWYCSTVASANLATSMIDGSTLRVAAAFTQIPLSQ